MVDTEKEVDFLKSLSVFKTFSKEQIQDIKDHFVEEKFPPNVTIINEGDLTNDVYLIVEGEVAVFKWDEDHLSEVIIGRIGKDDIFGEMSFIDNSPRSSTIRTIKPTTTLKLSKESLQNNQLLQGILTNIFAHIAEININRLRTSNQNLVKSLKEKQSFFKLWQDTGKFLFYVYFILALGVFLSGFFSKSLQPYLPWFIAAGPILLAIRENKFRWKNFGMNLDQWLSVTFTSCLTILIVWVGVFLAHFYTGERYFKDISPTLFNAEKVYSFGFLALYCFFHEFIARGVLQTSIQTFFQDTKGYKSLLINAAFLFLFFVSFGYLTALNIFIISLPLGLIYLKQKTLLGVFIIHLFLLVFDFIKF